MPATEYAAATLRKLMLALVAFGLIGLAIELAFLEHYEEPTMAIPFVAIAVALGAVTLHGFRPSRASVRILRVVMVAMAAVGALGVALHFRGSLEFQVDMDPTASAAVLFWKVMHMKAPPTLAPGTMVQLGLLGLLATWRVPTPQPSSFTRASQGESS